MSAVLSRRDFLKVTVAVGGGLALELSVFGAASRAAGGEAHEVTAWIVVRPDDTVTIRVARAEMGQGSFTGLPMLVAEELECDWGKVRAEFAEPHENLRRGDVWGSMSTGGSISTRGSQDYLRKAGASAREMLVAAAAERWNVPAAECTAAQSVITHAPTGRKLCFGEVAEAASRVPQPKSVKLKEPKEWKLIGRPTKQLDTFDKVTGKPLFGIDVRLPNMLHASIAQSPVFNGRVARVDATRVKAMRGVVQVVELPDAVAVVADNWWRANQALKALKVEWNEGEGAAASSATILEFVRSGLDDPKAVVARNDGSIDDALRGAAKIIEAEYSSPFLAHATMEPMNCTALVNGDKVSIWVPSQNAQDSHAAAAEAAGVPLANVEVHRTFLGGGFGRRGLQDYTKQAVLIAKAVPRRPVKLLWSREEDMQHDFYRPVTLVRFKAGLDAEGKVVAWHTRDSSHSIMGYHRPGSIKNGVDAHALGGLLDMPYQVPNVRVDFSMRNSHVPVGWWRTVFQSQNPFFRECFVDELAHAAGKDPYRLRRAMLQGPKGKRELGVLEAVAKAADWEKPLPRGVGRGIAVHDSHGSWSAAVFEVGMTGAGKLDIRRVVVATDCGYVLNPLTAETQVQSCVVYGLTAALFGEITIRNGRVEQSNFHDYRMMLMREVPKVECVFAPSGGFWGGMGETPLAPLAPALCNAIFAASGRRIRSLPLKNHGITLA